MQVRVAPSRFLVVVRDGGWSHGTAHPLRSKSGLPETRPTIFIGWDDEGRILPRASAPLFFLRWVLTGFIECCQRCRVFGLTVRRRRLVLSPRETLGGNVRSAPCASSPTNKWSNIDLTEAAVTIVTTLGLLHSPFGRTSYRGFLKNF